MIVMLVISLVICSVIGDRGSFVKSFRHSVSDSSGISRQTVKLLKTCIQPT